MDGFRLTPDGRAPDTGVVKQTVADVLPEAGGVPPAAKAYVVSVCTKKNCWGTDAGVRTVVSV